VDDPRPSGRAGLDVRREPPDEQRLDEVVNLLSVCTAERELFEENGSLKWRSSFKYDSHGNVTEETRTEGPMESLLRYDYRSEDRGNWIQREETISYDTDRKSEPSSPLLRVTTRTIPYFDDVALVDGRREILHAANRNACEGRSGRDAAHALAIS
jgi:hypothetical protein